VLVRQPGEWEPHAAVWSAWPSHAELWEEDLAGARAEVSALFHAIHDGGRGEALHILVHGDEARASAQAALASTGATLHDIPFGDIWLRDTAPIFVRTPQGIQAASFGFNGWGSKYQLPHDADVSLAVAGASGLPFKRHDWVLEGGSIDPDGLGWALTTEECLLNPNRNPTLSRADIERRLAEHLGIEQLVWLGAGLANDHTDGHIDNLARMIGPRHALVPEARGSDDPNRDAYIDARKRCEAAGLTVSVIPSPGRVEDEDGEPIPASSMNFYIANSSVIVPLYNSRWDDAIVQELGALFPGRRCVGLPAMHVLTGGGSFHCITQHVPLA
jgi:agmatine deiminase